MNNDDHPPPGTLVKKGLMREQIREAVKRWEEQHPDHGAEPATETETTDDGDEE